MLSVKDVLEVTGGRLITGDVEHHFSGAVIDSREAQPGDLFFPLEGEKDNGHRFILHALEKGAAGSLLEKKELHHFGAVDFSAGKILIVVENSLLSLQQLARFHRSRFDIPLIAVTGSNGKTTTKDFVASVLSRRYDVLKTQGNLNNHIGLPLMLLRLNEAHEAAVLELGMSGFGEIALLASLSSPTAGVMTNIGEAHLEQLGSQENIARAKGELLEFMGPESALFLNADDPHLCRMVEGFHGKIVTYGFTGKAHYRTVGYRSEDPGYGFEAVLSQKEKFRKETFWIPVPGRHNVYNALAAVAVGCYFDLTVEQIRLGLAQADVSSMRMERSLTKKGFWIINDAYNASPTSVKYALEFLVEWGGKHKKIAVLGDMLELGEVSEASHCEAGRYAAEIGIDYLVTFGELAEYMAQGAARAGLSLERIFPCKAHEDAIHCLEKLVEKDAIVLIKGSRGMKMEGIVEALTARYN